jgi:predicted RNase H-like nuclease (RuvC/YqgF family)
MTKENFENLLTDLYTAYNPSYLKLVPGLVEKYHRMEHDALENIFIRYNTKDAPHYDPEKDTDEFRIQIIKDYEEGRRSLKGFSLEMEVERKRKEEEARRLKELEEQGKEKEEDSKKLQEIQQSFSQGLEAKEKEIENLKKQIEKLGEGDGVKRNIYEEAEILIQSNYTESELILPNKEMLAGLGIGAMVVVKDKNGKTVGLIVENIIYDCVTEFDGRPVLEIILNKK